MKYQENDLTIAAFNKGSERAFTALYERLYSGAYYYARKFVSETDASDIVSDAFFRLWKAQGNFENIANVKAFLIITVRNISLNYLESEKYRNKVKDEISSQQNDEEYDWLDDQEQQAIRHSYLQLVYAAVEILHNEKRAVFNLAFIEGLKNPEIAARLNISEKKVRDVKSRTLKYVKEIMNKKGVLLLRNFLFTLSWFAAGLLPI